jgi:murein DD-endopeptidase MepM/ murein hydrolase activator NlpD
MTENFTPNLPQDADEEDNVQPEENLKSGFPKTWRQLWGRLLLLGLGETTLRILTGIFSAVLILIVVWVMSTYFLNEKQSSAVLPTTSTTQQATAVPFVANINSPALASSFSITRMAQIHTILPSHPRDQIITYTILAGDTLDGIADKFGLKPESILLSNRYVLTTLPENLQPGTVINIPPVDGAIYKWVTGDGLNGVAAFYEVTPDVIINWPGNNLNKDTIGDLSLPNIPDGTMLFIPGGFAESDWLPQVSRDTPAVSTSYGAGFCGKITDGYTGTGTFIWPTTEQWLSGFDYTSTHHGIDIAGQLDNPVFASDTGVVVYAGSNSNGYGNLVILDHGNGWQTVYGHLDQILVTCAQNVIQGQTIGLLGSTGNSTGPHLHFEIRKDGGYVNPHDLLGQ